MTPTSTQPGTPTPRQQEIVDQSTDVRDPADDSGEVDDPTALAEVYPPAFDESVEEAAAVIAATDTGRDSARP